MIKDGAKESKQQRDKKIAVANANNATASSNNSSNLAINNTASSNGPPVVKLEPGHSDGPMTPIKEEPGLNGTEDLKPGLIGSTNGGTVPTSETQDSVELGLDTPSDVKASDSSLQVNSPSVKVKTEDANNSHDFGADLCEGMGPCLSGGTRGPEAAPPSAPGSGLTSGGGVTPGGAPPSAMGTTVVGPGGLGGPSSNPSGPPTTVGSAVQPLPSNVVGKQQPATMEAQYMQQQSQIFVFSTTLVNKSAEAVMQGEYPSIIAYHCAQPGTRKYLEKHPLKLNQFQRQNPAQWLNNLAQMKQKGSPGALGGMNKCNMMGAPGPGGFPPHANMMNDMGPGGPMTGSGPMGPGGPMVGPPFSGGSMGPGSGPMGPGSGPMGPGSGPMGPGSGPMGPGMGPGGPMGPGVQGGGPMSMWNQGHGGNCNNPMFPQQMGPGGPMSGPGPGAPPGPTGVPVGGPGPRPVCPTGPPVSTASGPAVPGNPSGPGGPTTPGTPGGGAGQPSLLPEDGVPSDLAGLPDGSRPLQGVKVPDENLTPQQLQHREESLATLRKFQQIFFPENDKGRGGPGGPGGPCPSSGGPPGPCLGAGPGGPGTPNQIGPVSIEWQKVQQQFLEEKKKRGSVDSPQGPTMGMMGPNGPIMGPNGSQIGPGGPMCPGGPQMGPTGPQVGPNGPPMGSNNLLFGPNGGQRCPGPGAAPGPGPGPSPRAQGPPPPYHQTPRSASVPTPTPPPMSPNNPTSNLSLPSPRTSSGLNSPAEPVRNSGTSRGVDSPSGPRSLNPSNPGTPVSSTPTHMSPPATRKQESPHTGTAPPTQSPVDGMFCRTLQSLAQQQQQQQQAPQSQQQNQAGKEPNLMPVPSPQQIQYLNTFDGQELTIQKQPNTSLKDSSILSPSLESGMLGEHGRDSGTPLTPSFPSTPGESRFPVPSPHTPSGGSGDGKGTPSQQQNRFGSRTPVSGSDTPMKCGPSPGVDRFPGCVSPAGVDSMGPPGRFVGGRSSSPSAQMTQHTPPGKASGGSGSGFMDGSSPGKDGSPCTRPDNVPLNPNTSVNSSTGAPKPSFDPISSLAQMSQQLTNNVAGSPSSVGGPNQGMLPFNSPPMHMMQINDIGMADGSSGGAGPPTSMGPMGNMVPMDGLPSTFSPSSGLSQAGSPKARGSSPFPGVPPGAMQGGMAGAMTPRMMTRVPGPGMPGPGMAGPGMPGPGMPGPGMPGPGMPGPGMPGPGMPGPGMPGPGTNPFNGANVQVKASAPNTIQYLPARPQNSGNSGPRGPPSLDFLPRFANLDSKGTSHNLQFYNSGQGVNSCGGPLGSLVNMNGGSPLGQMGQSGPNMAPMNMNMGPGGASLGPGMGGVGPNGPNPNGSMASGPGGQSGNGPVTGGQPSGPGSGGTPGGASAPSAGPGGPGLGPPTSSVATTGASNSMGSAGPAGGLGPGMNPNMVQGMGHGMGPGMGLGMGGPNMAPNSGMNIPNMGLPGIRPSGPMMGPGGAGSMGPGNMGPGTMGNSNMGPGGPSNLVSGNMGPGNMGPSGLGPGSMCPSGMGPSGMGPGMGHGGMGPGMGPSGMGPGMGHSGMGPGPMGNMGVMVPGGMGPGNMGGSGMGVMGPAGMGSGGMGPNMGPRGLRPNMNQCGSMMGGMMRMPGMGGAMYPGQPGPTGDMGPGSQMYVPGSKSSPMEASQPLPPSNYKNSSFLVSPDPNYPQQFYNFQQQLYATNTRSSQASVVSNTSFFPK